MRVARVAPIARRGRPEGSSRRAAALLASALLVAACESVAVTPKPPGPAQTGAVPATTSPIGSEGAPSPFGSIEPGPEPDPASSSLIAAAVSSGRLDETTALAYRVLAVFGDDRVPEEYRGEWEEDLGALDLAQERLASLPPETQEILIPYLTRPTDSRSVWAPPASTSTARLAVARLPAEPGEPVAAAPACENGWTHEQVTPFIPAMVWGQCDNSGNVVAGYDAVKQAFADLWNPMTKLMGDPIGDQAPFGQTTSPEEGDGMIDVYVVFQSQYIGTRWINPAIEVLAFARMVPAYLGNPGAQASSGYMVVNPLAGAPVGLKSTVAHEFFHVLQNSHNAFGKWLPGDVTHWFSEASATWSEHFFVPDLASRRSEVYPRFTSFQGSGKSLSANGDNNPYNSFIWPLFMQQETGSEQVIGTAWTKLEGKKGFTEFQDVVDGLLTFEEHFRDFAVRAWNEDLPGHPFTRFQELDGGFPADRPGAARTGFNNTLIPIDATGPPLSRNVDIPSLRPEYEILHMDPQVKKVTFDFSQLAPFTAVDVDVLLKIKNRDWVRRELPVDEDTIYCLDRKDEAVEKLILVISNHDKRPNVRVTGPFTIMPVAGPCGDLVGTLTITRFGQYSSTSGPAETYDEELTAVLSVNVKSDPDPLGGGGFVDAGSVLAVERQWSGEKRMGDCFSRYATKSEGSWEFKDQPVGPEWENGIGGFLEPVQGIVLLYVVFHYPFEVVDDTCNYVVTLDPAVHDAFGCAPGWNDAGILGTVTEVEGAPDTIDVSCDFERPMLGYDKVTFEVWGTLKLYDEEE